MRLWKGIAIGCTLSVPLWALIYWSAHCYLVGRDRRALRVVNAEVDFLKSAG